MRDVTVVKVLCTSTIRENRHQVEAAQCSDGLLRLFVDGQPEQHVWRENDVEECITRFLVVSHTLRLGQSPAARARAS